METIAQALNDPATVFAIVIILWVSSKILTR